MAFLIVFAVVFLGVFAGVFHWFGTPEERVRALSRRLRRAASVDPASAGAEVLAAGRVEAGPGEPLVGPVSGKPAVYLRVEGREETGEDCFTRRREELRAREFVVVQGDGARVPVRAATDAETRLLRTTSSGPVVQGSPAIVALLGESADPQGFVRRKEFVETALYAGDEVTVLGRLAPEPAREPPGDPYREHAARGVLQPTLVVRGELDALIALGRFNFDLAEFGISVFIALIAAATVAGFVTGGP